MNFNYSKLKGRIIEKYGSQENFSKELGLSMTSISNKMTGKTGFSQKDIVLWSELLDIEISEVGQYFYAWKVKPSQTTVTFHEHHIQLSVDTLFEGEEERSQIKRTGRKGK